jgi:ERCC4 domain
VICDRGRGREQRSQIVFTRARGREMVFWQSPRTRKQSRPGVRLPTARAQGIAELEILVDAHERCPFTFATQKARTSRRALNCGDYAIATEGRVVVAVERKSLADLVSSLTSGRLKDQLAELATLPRAAVVVEDRYSQIFALPHLQPHAVADGLAELHVRWPTVPVVYCETRKLAEEWTYRYLAAAHCWALEQHDPPGAHGAEGEQPGGPLEPSPSRREMRAWARANGLPVSDRGLLRPESTKPGATLTRPAARAGSSPRPTRADSPFRPGHDRNGSCELVAGRATEGKSSQT